MRLTPELCILGKLKWRATPGAQLGVHATPKLGLENNCMLESKRLTKCEDGHGHMLDYKVQINLYYIWLQPLSPLKT